MPLSNWSKDRYVAPHMSAFTQAQIPDMTSVSKEQTFWLANFILNTLMRADVEERSRQRMFNFLRRAELAFRDHSAARERSLAYLANPDVVLDYLHAIAHWEAFLSHSYQALMLISSPKQPLFDPNDGSEVDRLRLLYNRSKHIDGAIAKGQLTSEGTMGVWLTNDGLASTNSHLTFEETGTVLKFIARLSDRVQDPLTMHDGLANDE